MDEFIIYKSKHFYSSNDPFKNRLLELCVFSFHIHGGAVRAKNADIATLL